MTPRRAIFLLLFSSWSSLQICSYRKLEVRTKENKLALLTQISNLTLFTRFDPSKSVQISWYPRLFLYKAFLSDEECDHLISLAQGKLSDSLVMENGTSSAHTGSRTFLVKGQDEIVTRIEQRISAWTFLPKENGEEMQIQHYGMNESYEPQYDCDHEKSKQPFSGHRFATVLMYLSNVTLGGETVFPKSELRTTQGKEDTWSECAASGYSVDPIKGNALLFFNLHPDATRDESSLHGGCKVLKGEKWTVTKWIHVRAFNTSKATLASDGDCTDEDENCSHWAAVGECQRNPVYMLGTPDYYGTCRKSCGVC